MLASWVARVRTSYFVLLLCVITAGAFALSLRNGFVTLDDGLLIYRNVAVQELSFRSLRHIFTSYDPELYVPLTLLSYQLEHLIFGLWAPIYHITNLLLHMGSVLVLFAILRRLLRDDATAFIGALLFAIHPLQTEAVAWASGRKDVLSGLFFLLSILQYLRYRQHNHRSAYAWGIVCFLLALLSKVSVIMLPLVLLLLDWREDGRLSRRRLLEKWPFFLLSVIFGIIALFGKTQQLQTSGPFQTFLIGCKAIAFYCAKLFWPFGLTPIYPQLTPVSLSSPEFLLPLLFVISMVLTTIVLILRRTQRNIAFAFAFFLVMMIPNSTNFQKNEYLFFASDRYIYLAVIGLFFLVAVVIRRLLQSTRISSIVLTGTLIAMIFFATRTFAQTRIWENGETLYRHTLTIYPRSTLALNNLAVILIRSDRMAEGKQYVKEALRQNPRMMPALINQGLLLKQEKKFDDAIASYKRAVDVIDAKSTVNLDELGAYYYLGDLYDSLGRTQDAIATFQRAADKGSMFGEPFYNLGIMQHKHGFGDAAITSFEQCIALESLYIDCYYHLGKLYAERGRLPEAEAMLQRVVELNPNYEKAQEHLTNIRRLMGN